MEPNKLYQKAVATGFSVMPSRLRATNIMEAKRVPRKINRRPRLYQFWDSGFIMITAPDKPNNIAVHLKTPTFSPRNIIDRRHMKIGITCDSASALLISKWITDKYQNNNPNKPATLRRDIIFLFFILKYRTPPIVSPDTNRMGRQNKYLNISTKAKEMSLEKYFIIATIEVPTTISKNRNSTPRKYESLGDSDTLFKLLPRTFE